MYRHTERPCALCGDEVPAPDAGLREALEGMLTCFDELSDADVSALGMKRASRCVVEARAALAAHRSSGEGSL